MNQTIRKILSLFFLAALTNESHALYAPYGVYKEEGFLNGIARQHPIYEATAQCKLEEVVKNLNEGVSPNQGYIKGRDDFLDDKYTPLHYIINTYLCPPHHKEFTQEDGDIKLKIARTLLEHGANPNAKWDEYSGNERQSTYPLNTAIHEFQYQVYKKSDEYNQNSVDFQRRMISLLLEKGADVHLRGWKHYQDSTPLELLLRDKYDFNQEKIKEILIVAEELISKGAKVENKLFINLLENNENGKYDEILEFLIEHGANVNAVENGTPLLEFINDKGKKFLLEHGAKVSELSDYKQEQLKEEGIALSENATIGETIGFYLGKVWDLITSPIAWIWDFATSGTGLVIIGLLIVIYINLDKLKSLLKFVPFTAANKRKRMEPKIKKSNRELSRQLRTIVSIDNAEITELVEKQSQLKVKVAEIQAKIDAFKDKEENYNHQEFMKEIKTLDTEIEIFKKEAALIRENINRLEKIVSKMYDFLSEVKDKLSLTREEVLGYREFEGVESYYQQTDTLFSEVSNLLETVGDSRESYNKMKNVVEQYENTVENLQTTVEQCLSKWNDLKAKSYEYKPLLDRVRKVNQDSDKNLEFCRTNHEDDEAKKFGDDFAEITQKAKEVIESILDERIRREASYYDGVIRVLEARYKEIEKEYNEKYKDVREFNDLKNDSQKKKWIINRGRLSWFFKDSKIAEQFRPFDSKESMEALIEVSKAGLGLFSMQEPKESDIWKNWAIFIQIIRSDMSYQELKEYFDEVNKNNKEFRDMLNLLGKKTNEKPEAKAAFDITRKFLNAIK